MSTYLSSLYGPVYLVSHIVTMYLMPELGLIVAHEVQDFRLEWILSFLPVTTAVHVTMQFLPIKMTFSDWSSVKDGDDWKI